MKAVAILVAMKAAKVAVKANIYREIIYYDKGYKYEL